MADPFKDLKGSAAIEAQLERERAGLKATGGELRARLAPSALAQSALDGAMALGERTIKAPLAGVAADVAALAGDVREGRVVKAALSGVHLLRGRGAEPRGTARAVRDTAAFVAEATGAAGKARRAARLREADEARAETSTAEWCEAIDARADAVRAEIAALKTARRASDRAAQAVDEATGESRAAAEVEAALAEGERRFEAARSACLARFAADARADLARGLDDLPSDLRAEALDAREAHYRHHLSQLARGKGRIGRLIEDHPMVATAAAAALGMVLAAVLTPGGPPSDET